MHSAVYNACLLNAALSNVVCLHNAFFLSFLPLIYANAFCFHAFSWFIEKYFFQVLFCIQHSAFNLLVFPNSMLTPFFIMKELCIRKKWHL